MRTVIELRTSFNLILINMYLVDFLPRLSIPVPYAVQFLAPPSDETKFKISGQLSFFHCTFTDICAEALLSV